MPGGPQVQAAACSCCRGLGTALTARLSGIESPNTARSDGPWTQDVCWGPSAAPLPWSCHPLSLECTQHPPSVARELTFKDVHYKFLEEA